MFNIAGYLDRFKKIGAAKDVMRQAAADSFKEAAGVVIDPKSVVISKGEISVATAPLNHSLVFMRRERIIAALKERLPDISIDRIRCR
jgi:hypothetical protein